MQIKKVQQPEHYKHVNTCNQDYVLFLCPICLLQWVLSNSNDMISKCDHIVHIGIFTRQK